jgi:hypothetical protein
MALAVTMPALTLQACSSSRDAIPAPRLGAVEGALDDVVAGHRVDPGLSVARSACVEGER